MSLKATPLLETHRAAGARLVDFGGWEMPLHYGSQIEEHHAVRAAAGMFDVSHMTVVDLHGARVRDFLRYLLANDVMKLRDPGRALYTCMLNESGGVIDDLIVYFLDEQFFRLVVNAATRDKDLAWIAAQAPDFDVTVTERADLAMIAVQGPQARELALPLLPAPERDALTALKPFNALQSGAFFVARTGYTGEDGFEIILPNDEAVALWDALAAVGVQPCGLGARDTLRLEAGLHLYGSDMDDSTTPLETGLAWTVAFEPPERDFIGRDALVAQRADGVPTQLAALVLQARGVLRAGQTVHAGDLGDGLVTSGTFSPTMKKSIALARVPTGTKGECHVEIRGARLPASVHRPPFVRNGQIKIDV